MKPKLINILLYPLLLLLPLLQSCSSDKLTRNQAEVLIQNYFEYPIIEVSNFNLENIFGNPLEPLINQGYIYINKRNFLWSNAATQKGEKFQSKSNKNLFATNTKSFNEITGIVFLDEKESKAKIEYTCKKSNITPFGEFLGFHEGQIIACSVEAMKYDDGWRITSEKGNIFKPTDFSYSKENNSVLSLEESSVSTENKIEFNQSDANALQILQGKWYGKIGEKNFTLNIETVGRKKVSGYNIAGTNQRPVSGSYSFFNGGRICILELKEPGDDKWDGTFKIEMEVYSDNWAGTGTWKAYNGKLSNPVSINRRLPDNPNDFVTTANSSSDGDKFIGVWLNSNNDKVKISKSGEIYKVAFQPDEDEIFDFEAPYKNGTIKCPFGQDNKDTIIFSLVGNQLKFIGDWDSHSGPETYLFNKE